MYRRLTILLKGGRGVRKKPGGFTLTEVVVASTLLIIAIVPVLKALTGSYLASTLIEQRTTSLVLAQAKLHNITTRSIYYYDSSLNETDTALGDSYFCNVNDVAVHADLRGLTITVGYDADGDSTLDGNEVLVTLATRLARRW
jgi:type II secretory pathway pseudopilin PulG